MKAEHEAKINELVDTLASSIKVRAMSLASSGGIDEDNYNVNEYVLAKILVTAAVYQLKDSFALMDKQYKKAVKNLEYF